MKLFTLFLNLLIVLLLFVCCENDANKYTDLLAGTWVNTKVDDVQVETDAAFVSDFREKNVEMYAVGIYNDPHNKSWVENTDYVYIVEDNKVIINGHDVSGNRFHLIFNIISLNKDVFKYSVERFSINDVDYPDNSIYTLEKVNSDLKSRIKGIWHETSSNTIFEFLDNGKYLFYVKDENNNWKLKSDNDGSFFTYGNFLATNYKNDIYTGVLGNTYMCWLIEIDDSTMRWHRRSAEGIILEYNFEKKEMLSDIK